MSHHHRQLARRLRGRYTLLAAGVMLLGCRTPLVGPNYCPPTVPVPTAWSGYGQPIIEGQPAELGGWWRQFGDPCLSGIVEELTTQNLTLREAGHRVEESRARLGVARGALWPQQQTLNGSYAKSRISRNTANFFEEPGVFVPELSVENWRVGLSTAWELDFWGRYRRAIEAASAEVEVSLAAYDDARVLLISEAVQAYVAMRSAEQRYDLALRNAEILRKTYELVQVKEEAGAASTIDVAQAESNLRDVEALAPLFLTKRRQASHRLSVLMGHPPTTLAFQCPPTGQLPIIPPKVAVGIPCDLLRQRPDVREAERRLAAQSARIGVAEAEFYPQIGLTGSIGMEAEDLSKLFRSTSGVGAISPYFRWNILNYGRIESNVRAENEAFLSLCAAYENEVLNALREAEDAQVALVNGGQRVASLKAAARAAGLAAEKAEVAYEEGATDFSRVYLLQSDLVERQDRVAAVEAELVESVVDLYKALGGGWRAMPYETECVPMMQGMQESCSRPAQGSGAVAGLVADASSSGSELFAPPVGASPDRCEAPEASADPFLGCAAPGDGAGNEGVSVYAHPRSAEATARRPGISSPSGDMKSLFSPPTVAAFR